MNARLARLSLRRALPLALLALGLALAALVVGSAWQPDDTLSTALAGSDDAAALARAGAWAGLLALWVPWFLAAAGSVARRWRAGEIEWLARSARGPLAVVSSIWIGLALAAALAIGASGVAAELAAARRPAGPLRELAARFAVPAALLMPGSAPLRVTFDPGPLPAGARARVHLAYLGGGPSADLRVWCAPERSFDAALPHDVLVSSGHALEYDLDPAGGPYRMVLEHAGGQGAVQLAGDGLEVVVPLEHAGALSVRFALRAWVALAALLALALGLGAWMGGPTTFGLCVALTLAALLAGGAVARWLPSAGLGDAYTLLGEGLAGPWLTPRAWTGAVLCVSAGLLGAARGLAHWRSAAR